MPSGDAASLAILILLLALSAFFSSAETAMTTVNRIRIKTLAEDGNPRAATMMKIMEHSEKMLSAILIGNNLVNISASSLATTLAMHLFGNGAVAIATGVLTLLVLIFGEITPKNLAARNADKMSLAYAGVIWPMMWIMTPAIFLVNTLSGAFLKLLHVDRDSKDVTITPDELRTLVEEGHKDGTIESEERKMINNVFDFGEAQARDIMVPRAEMSSVNIHATYEEVYELFRQDKFTRLPVYDRDRDNIIGIINVKDFMFVTDHEGFSARSIMYEPHFTYEPKKISELMDEMRGNSISMTFVLDEYGSVIGLITLEDLLEEIVGEIRDEYDEDEKDLIRDAGDGRYFVEGSLKLDDLNEALGLNLESEDFDSVGGLIIDMLEHLPTVGESVRTPEGHILEVCKMKGHRIARVRLTLAPETGSEGQVH